MFQVNFSNFLSLIHSLKNNNDFFCHNEQITILNKEMKKKEQQSDEGEVREIHLN